VLDALGPDHEKLFRIEVRVDGEVLGHGEGPSRRVAETEAAARALERLRDRDELEEDDADRPPPTAVGEA
jgi:ribonuclease-3